MRNRRGDFTYLTRAFERGTGMPEEEHDDNCNNMTGREGPLGPCLTVSPGQSISIKVINRMGNAMKQTFTHIPNYTEWLGVMEMFGNTTSGFGEILFKHGSNPTGKIPAGISDFRISQLNKENLPGYDTGHAPPDAHRDPTRLGESTWGFDSTNIHLHGMEVEPHLFHPQARRPAPAEEPAPPRTDLLYVWCVGNDEPGGTVGHNHSG